MDALIRILVIGCGPHATHFYLPSLCRMAGEGRGVSVAGVLDITTNREFVCGELSARGIPCPAMFVEPFDGDSVSEEARLLLDGLVDAGKVNAVIISTDPLHHRCYASWAIGRGLPILMDKPVTTRVDAACDLGQAAGIERDYEALLAEYLACPKPRAPFVLCAHRRYHPGIREARRIVADVCALTGCPVTNIACAHADGQFRLPHEIYTQRHHSYNQGHGKISHSGFHFIDCIAEFWRDGLRASGKSADEVEVFSSFVRPDGFARQLSRTDYHRLFGRDAYESSCPESEAKLADHYRGCGGLDADCVLTMRTGGVPFSMASLSLLHDSYSRRGWLAPDRDLYKGNGRVKHEDHSVQVGPFLNLRIHSYQSKDRHDVCRPGEDERPGGNNHFEMLVFRNENLIGGKAFEKFDLREIGSAREFDGGSLFITQVKERSILEWVKAIRNPGEQEGELLSAFSDHRMGVRLMSAIYRSYAKRQYGESPLECVGWLES